MRLSPPSLPPTPAADLAIPSTQRVLLLDLGSHGIAVIRSAMAPIFNFVVLRGLPIARIATNTTGAVFGG
jgi:hypothetical protein